MKITTLILATALLAVSLFSTGCQTTSGLSETPLIQMALDEVLPAGFEGDFEGQHDGYYFGTSVHLTIDLHGLKNTDGKWTWASGGYVREGFFSKGKIKLTPKTP